MEKLVICHPRPTITLYHTKIIDTFWRALYYICFQPNVWNLNFYVQWSWLDYTKRSVKLMQHMHMCRFLPPHPNASFSKLCLVTLLGFMVRYNRYVIISFSLLKMKLYWTIVSYEKSMLKCLTLKMCLFLNQWKVGMTKGW